MSSVKHFPKVRNATPGDNATLAGTCVIPLTQGYSALVDPEDFERFGHLKWTATVQKKRGVIQRVYAYRNVRGEDGKLHNLFLHRAVMNAGPEQHVDHRLRGLSTLDCRHSNLRWATQSQNCANKTPSPGVHGFFGIETQPSGTYRGRVYVTGHSYCTKSYRNPFLAAVARDALAIKLHGEFAVLNFPLPFEVSL